MADKSLGTAVLRTRLDATGLRAGLGELETQSGRTLASIEQRVQATGRTLRNVGTGLSIGVTAPLAVIATASVRAASAAEETEAKFQTVFSNIGDDAQAAADRLSDAFGQSDRAAQSLLANTGDLLTGFGFQQSAALEVSAAVNELAVDLASFSNFAGGAEGASRALTSALLGEREAAKSLGIVITEELVKAKLEELRVTGELRGETEQQQKAFATLLIAQEQSQNAIGDFARTQDSFANQTRQLSSAVDDLRVALGEGILPVITPLVERITGVVEAFSELDSTTRNVVLVIGGVTAAIGPLLIAVGNLAIALPAVAAGFGAIATAALPLLGPAALIAGGIVLVDRLSRSIGDGNVGLIGRARQLGDAIFGWTAKQRDANLALSETIRLTSELNSLQGGGEAEGGGGGGGGRRATSPEPAAVTTVGSLEADLRELEEAFRNAATEAERLAIAGEIRQVRDQLDSLTAVLDDTATSAANVSTNLASGYERTVANVFSDVEAIGVNAEQRAAAFGGTIDAQLASIQTRYSAIDSAIDELIGMGLDATDARIQYLIGRLRELADEADSLTPRRLVIPEVEIRTDGAPTRESIIEVSSEAAARADAERAAQNDAGVADARRQASQDAAVAFWTEVRRQADTDALAAGIRVRQDQDARPTPFEAREAFGPGAGILEFLQAGGAQGSPTDGSVSPGELAARESEIAFDEYLSGIPDAATDLSLSADELSRAAARISLDQGQDAVLGVLSRAQTDTIATGRRPGELGPFTPGFGVPAPLLDDQGREGIAPAFDADEFTTKFEDANERAAAEQRQASLDFAENVIDAGSGFINAIESFRSGDIGGGIAGLGGTIGSLFTSIGGALGPIGQVLGPITGLLGGAVSLFSPREADGAGASGQEFDRFSSTPAININVSVEQENTYNGGPTDPAIEQAFLRQTRQVVEEILDRSGLLQELRELKGAT